MTSPILVNGRFLGTVQPTGTQRSAFFLLRALAECERPLKILSPGPVSFPLDLTSQMQAVGHFPSQARLHPQLWEQFVFPRIKPRCWHLNLMGTSSAFFSSKRCVSLVHDLNYQLIPSAFSWKFRLWYHFACGFAARRAVRLLCNSHYTLEIIGRFLGDKTASKCKVVRFGPGIDEDLLSSHSSEKSDYLLCVGSLQPHKNLANILSAYALISAKTPGVKLKIVGRPQKFFNSLNITKELLSFPGIEFTGYVTDGELADLYKGALAFVYPSIEEGFGLPVVEAFYSGCPVITSNRSCLPEVAGEAAVLVDPFDPQSIGVGILSILQDSALREQKLEAARARIKQFRWENGARDIIDHIYA